ncbi:hypothetical protein AB1Y20_018253 [Prymnesium parvum]|uniref:Uncharacterized protein n=1 Tax=Prymnesium parvum TaxID=97485 RepID=A0AB34JQY9_PRYPA
MWAGPPVAPTSEAALSRVRAHRLARNVPLSANPDLNPALTPAGLLGQLVSAWDRIFVLCYAATCAVHTAAGAADGRRVWWPAVQPRVDVFDAAELDRRHAAVVRWAGCELSGRPAGRSGAPAVAEPCAFAHRLGGADWRRTSKHRLLALLAHLALVREAAARNLSSVLVVEADLVQAIAVEELFAEADAAARVARHVGHALAARRWGVVRLSAMFYSKEYLPGGRRRRGVRQCTNKCRCTPWEGAAGVDAPLRICKVAAAPQPEDTISRMLQKLHEWCDVRDTAAYAVHASAYAKFDAYYSRLLARPQWLKGNAAEVPAIDNWLPHAIDCLYVLPTLVSQPSMANSSQGATALMRQTSARNFMAYCAHDGPAVTPEESALDRKPMKLQHFATRHLYVLKD